MTTLTAAITYQQEKRATGVISQATEQTNRGILIGFVDLCPRDPARIRKRDVVRWLRTISHLAPATRRRYYSLVRGFTCWLARRGIIARDPFADLPAPKVPRAVHRALSPAQVAALLLACLNERDRVIVLLGLHTGLRRAELAALELGDVDLAARTVFVRCGKGGAQRVVPLSVEAAQVVGRYVASAGLSCGPLLRSQSEPHRGIKAQTVGTIFSRLAYRAGVKVRPGDGIACHATRHTAATNWYEASGDVLAVRDLLGHQSLATTQIYVRGFNVERLRSTVERTVYLPAA